MVAGLSAGAAPSALFRVGEAAGLGFVVAGSGVGSGAGEGDSETAAGGGVSGIGVVSGCGLAVAAAAGGAWTARPAAAWRLVLR